MQDTHEREPTDQEIEDVEILLEDVKEDIVVYSPRGTIITPKVPKYSADDLKALELLKQRRLSLRELRRPVKSKITRVERSALQAETERIYGNRRRQFNSSYYIKSMCDNMRERIEMGYTVHFGDRIYFVPPKRLNHA